MWTILLGLCTLACPLSMVAMMLMMRRGRGRESSPLPGCSARSGARGEE
jgi:hypothetical protein